ECSPVGIPKGRRLLPRVLYARRRLPAHWPRPRANRPGRACSDVASVPWPDRIVGPAVGHPALAGHRGRSTPGSTAPPILPAPATWQPAGLLVARRTGLGLAAATVGFVPIEESCRRQKPNPLPRLARRPQRASLGAPAVPALGCSA